MSVTFGLSRYFWPYLVCIVDMLFSEWPCRKLTKCPESKGFILCGVWMWSVGDQSLVKWKLCPDGGATGMDGGVTTTIRVHPLRTVNINSRFCVGLSRRSDISLMTKVFSVLPPTVLLLLRWICPLTSTYFCPYLAAVGWFGLTEEVKLWSSSDTVRWE